MIRIVVADDQSLVRAGFRVLLHTQPDLAVVGEAGDGAQAVALTRAERPDVVLMDVQMPGMDGLEATTRLIAEGSLARILMLTTFDDDESVYQALHAGASGFLLKSVPPEQLLDGIRRCAAGESLLAPTITRRLIEHYVSRPRVGASARLQGLTQRELEVLTKMATGASNTEIAETLFLSEATVKTHVSRVLGKLGLRDRAQAVVVAYETGLVQPGTTPTPGPDRTR